MILEKRVLVVAETILSALVTSIRVTETLLKDIKSTAGDSSMSLEDSGEMRRRPSIERLRNLVIADSKESWRENAQRAADERRRYLIVSADMFTSLAKLRAEMFELCRVPGAEEVEKLFSTMRDPYKDFMNRHLVQYLEIQKKWIDDQLGVAFFEINRIDLHAPRLAPRERSNADVYHIYRSFYGHVSSNFHQMTKMAIQSTHESICRSAAVLRSIQEESTPSEDGILLLENNLAVADNLLESKPLEKSEPDKISKNDEGMNGTEDTETGEGSEGLASARSPSSLGDKRQIIRELLDSLVMNYLANAETLLQAATHLLPLCEKDAKMHQLWVSGASPLTSYVKAIELLAKSNECLSRFILTLEVPHDTSVAADTQLSEEPDLNSFIPKETREVLHGELTSGLSDLSAEAQVGVKAAVSSLRARLFAILKSPQATEVYNASKETRQSTGRQDDVAAISSSGFDLEPSDAFISASTLIDQQLQAVMETVKGANRNFVVGELRSTTREAVLRCWCSIGGTVTSAGALQLIADGKSILRVFQDHRSSGEAVECLPAVGQLFLEGADGLWSCVESNALANVDAGIVIALLRKRDDFKSERVSKVCQSLGAELSPCGES